jgi:DNA-binding IclR family transcriptional regulator
VNSSALHVFQVLRVLSRAREPLGVAEIARRVGLSPSTAHRALITLEEARYLKRAPYSSRFMPGPMTQSLARSLFRHFKLRKDGHPILQELTRTSGATVSLAVRVGWYAMRILVVSPRNLIFAQHRLGETRPLHETVEGRAILAEIDADEASRYRHFIRTHHPATAHEIERGAFWKELRKVRSQSIASENTPAHGLYVATISLRLPDGRPVAAVLASRPIASTTRSAAKGLPKLLQTMRGKFEEMIAAKPDAYLSRFSAIDPNQIFFPSDIPTESA